MTGTIEVRMESLSISLLPDLVVVVGSVVGTNLQKASSEPKSSNEKQRGSRFLPPSLNPATHAQLPQLHETKSNTRSIMSAMNEREGVMQKVNKKAGQTAKRNEN